MAEQKYDPMRVSNKNVTEMDRIELCTLAMKLCDVIQADAPDEFRGGVFPSNITICEDGKVLLGPGKQAGWEGEELKFIAPELYWAGRRSPATDVYSLGLLLYYGVTGGKLPFEGISKNPEQTRMSGEKFTAPEAAGPNLGAVIQKATVFNISGRYQTMGDMRKALMGCVNNLFLMGSLDVRTVFGKEAGQLSETERMMAGIMGAEQSVIPDAITPAQVEATEVLAPEAFNENDIGEAQKNREEELRKFKRNLEAAADEVAAQKAEAYMEGLIAEIGLSEKTAAEPVRVTTRVGPVDYVAKKDLDDERLEPIYFSEPGVIPAVQYTRNLERERKVRAEMKRRRRRPILVILLLCIIMVAGAAGYNELTMRRAGIRTFADNPALNPAQTVQPSDAMAEESILMAVPETVAEEPEAEIPEVTPEPREPEYELVVSDIGWTAAEQQCEARGGHLIVINSAAELQMVIDMAESAGIDRIWIGLSRTPDDGLIWCNGDLLTYYQWGKGEPSKFDGDIEENYVMLWYLNGWYYNDTIDDPAGEYPEMYSGRLGYVCEIE